MKEIKYEKDGALKQKNKKSGGKWLQIFHAT